MIGQKNNNQNPSLFRSFINSSITASSDVQKNYLQVVKNVCETIKKLLNTEKMIINVQYQPKEFWQKAKNFTSCFVDGGIDKASIFSSAPLSIRAGSYIVNPSSVEKNRELYEESMVFVGDLYDPKNELYEVSDDPFEDDQLLNKKKDAARIIFESATIVKHILLKRKLSYCFLHGPVEATAMPFTSPDFPSFTKFAVEQMLPFTANMKMDNKDRHFINIYLKTLECIKNIEYPIYGIVENTHSSIFLRNFLFNCKKKNLISNTNFEQTIATLKRYKLSDPILLEIILEENQAVKPLSVQKQSFGFGFLPGSEWEQIIKKFPDVYMGYLKVNSQQAPIRIESLHDPKNLEIDFEYILATSKLLPNYGFPVGLDVVDKFARIPKWLGKASRTCYATFRLKEALKGSDQSTISAAVKILSKKGRTWRNRPMAGGFR